MPWVSASVVGDTYSPPPFIVRSVTCSVPPRKLVPVQAPAVTASQLAKSAVNDHFWSPAALSGKSIAIMSGRPSRDCSVSE